MPTHNQAWIETFENYNCIISATELQEMAGTPNEETAVILCSKYHVKGTPSEIAKNKEILAKKLLLGIKPFPEIEYLVKYFHGKIPLGIVSGSTHELINLPLDSYQFKKAFDVIISCEDTVRGKPFPDPFIAAAQYLNIPAEKCLVFEDGDLGIIAAKAGGMQTVKVIDGKCQWPIKI
jgi:beta-phosphoglucomutase-like phosphatase (HAD superfamily)